MGLIIKLYLSSIQHGNLTSLFVCVCVGGGVDLFQMNWSIVELSRSLKPIMMPSKQNLTHSGCELVLGLVCDMDLMARHQCPT